MAAPPAGGCDWLAGYRRFWSLRLDGWPRISIVMKPAEGDGMKLFGTLREIEPPIAGVQHRAGDWSERRRPSPLVRWSSERGDGATEVTVIHGGGAPALDAPRAGVQ